MEIIDYYSGNHLYEDHLCLAPTPGGIASLGGTSEESSHTPNPPTNIVPTNIARLKLSRKSPMGLSIPPL